MTDVAILLCTTWRLPASAYTLSKTVPSIQAPVYSLTSFHQT